MTHLQQIVTRNAVSATWWEIVGLEANTWWENVGLKKGIIFKLCPWLQRAKKIYPSLPKRIFLLMTYDKLTVAKKVMAGKHALLLACAPAPNNQVMAS